MFTGLIEAVGTIREQEKLEDGVRYFIETELYSGKAPVGGSVSVSGVCLTVTDPETDGFWVDVSGETLDKTTMSTLSTDDSVNLEPSLKVGDELGGHFVFGHVDTTVPIKTLEKRGDFHELKVQLPEKVRPFVAPKGSIALDGISLTVNEINDGLASIRIIPHTYRETRLRTASEGESMNLEVDMLARYVYNKTVYLQNDVGDFLPDDPSGPGGMTSSP
ncbi:MAG: riboflavin synthase [bacterium]